MIKPEFVIYIGDSSFSSKFRWCSHYRGVGDEIVNYEYPRSAC